MQVCLVMAKIREAAAASTAVDIGEMMNTFANDIISRAVSGKFFRAEGRNKLFRELANSNSVLLAGFNLEDYFPGLANSLGFLTGWFMRTRIHKAHKRWDDMLEKIINDHEGRKSVPLHDQESDFTDVLLSVQQEYGITRDHIKAILIVSDRLAPNINNLLIFL